MLVYFSFVEIERHSMIMNMMLKITNRSKTMNVTNLENMEKPVF